MYFGIYSCKNNNNIWFSFLERGILYLTTRRYTEVKTRYQQTLDENLAKNPTEGTTLQTKWNSISEAIKSAAEISVGLQERPKHNNRSPDAVIGALSVQQKQI